MADEKYSSILLEAIDIVAGKTVEKTLTDIGIYSRVDEDDKNNKYIIPSDPFAEITQEIAKSDIGDISLPSGNNFVTTWEIGSVKKSYEKVGVSFVIDSNNTDDYGCEIFIYGNNRLYTMNYHCSEMLGDYKNFPGLLQKKLYDLVDISSLQAIGIRLYNKGNGSVVFNNIQLIAGYNLENYDQNSIGAELSLAGEEEKAEYYSNQNKTLKGNKPDKVINLKYIYQNKEGKFQAITNVNAQDKDDTTLVRWYKYTPNDAQGDSYGGANWKLIENQENPFQLTLSHTSDWFDADQKNTQYKVVILQSSRDSNSIASYTSNILSFKNNIDNENNDLLKTRVISILDGTNGLYPYYSFNQQLLAEYAYKAHEKRVAKAIYSTEMFAYDIWHSLKKITWKLPYDLVLFAAAGETAGRNEHTEAGYQIREWEGCFTPEELGVDVEKADVQERFETLLDKYLSVSYHIVDERVITPAANKMICEITFTDNKVYTFEKEINLTVAGTNGTGYTVVTSLQDGKGRLRRAICPKETLYLKIDVYDKDGNLLDIPDSEISIYDQYSGVLFVEKESVELSSRVLTIPYSSLYGDFNALRIMIALGNKTITYKTGEITEQRDENGNIIQVEEEKTVIKDIYLQEIIPIPIASSKDLSYCGPDRVLYGTSGTNPQYNDKNISIYSKDGEHVQGAGEGIFNIETGGKDFISLIEKTIGSENNQYKTASLVPTAKYDVSMDTTPIGIKISWDNNNYWFQPILMYQNRYFSSIINEWDGSLQIDEQGNYILASAYVAGSKNKDNLFTGVIVGELGTIADGGTDTESGVFGYKEGTQTFGFKNDGTGFIGSASGGRINFDGNQSTIESGNYKNDDNGGYAESGMKIDLDDGTIDSPWMTVGGGGARFRGQIVSDGGTYYWDNENKKVIEIPYDTKTFYAVNTTPYAQPDRDAEDWTLVAPQLKAGEYLWSKVVEYYYSGVGIEDLDEGGKTRSNIIRITPVDSDFGVYNFNMILEGDTHYIMTNEDYEPISNSPFENLTTTVSVKRGLETISCPLITKADEYKLLTAETTYFIYAYATNALKFTVNNISTDNNDEKKLNTSSSYACAIKGFDDNSIIPQNGGKIIFKLYYRKEDAADSSFETALVNDILLDQEECNVLPSPTGEGGVVEICEIDSQTITRSGDIYSPNLNIIVHRKSGDEQMVSYTETTEDSGAGPWYRVKWYRDIKNKDYEIDLDGSFNFIWSSDNIKEIYPKEKIIAVVEKTLKPKGNRTEKDWYPIGEFHSEILESSYYIDIWNSFQSLQASAAGTISGEIDTVQFNILNGTEQVLKAPNAATLSVIQNIIYGDDGGTGEWKYPSPSVGFVRFLTNGLVALKTEDLRRFGYENSTGNSLLSYDFSNSCWKLSGLEFANANIDVGTLTIQYCRYEKDNENDTTSTLHVLASSKFEAVKQKQGEKGTAARYLTLDNDSDVFARRSTGEIAKKDNKVTTINAKRYIGDEYVTMGYLGVQAPDNFYNDYYLFDNSTGKLTIVDVPVGIESGEFTFYWKANNSNDAEILATKKFSFKVIHSEFDYNIRVSRNLINPSNESSDKLIEVWVEKVSADGIKNIEWTNKGTTTAPEIVERTNNTIKLTWSPKSVRYDGIDNYTKVKLLYQDPSSPITLSIDNYDTTDTFNWDTEVIEFVQNGASAASLDIYSSTYVVRRDIAGNLIPNEITITAESSNLDGSYNFNITSDGSTTAAGFSVSNVVGSSNQKKIALTNKTYKGSQIQATVSRGGRTDTTSIIIVEDGPRGNNGASGYSVATINLYKRSEKVPKTSEMPNGTFTYNFNNKELTKVDNANFNGWSQEIPSGTDPCYIVSAVASAQANPNGDTVDEEVTFPDTALLYEATDGYSNYVITLYQRSDTIPTVNITSEYYYDFSTGQLMNSATGGNVINTIGQWFINIPSGESPCYFITALAQTKEAGSRAKIAPDSWNTDPVQFVANGEDAITISLSNPTMTFEENDTSAEEKCLTQCLYGSTIINFSKSVPGNSHNDWIYTIKDSEGTLLSSAEISIDNPQTPGTTIKRYQFDFYKPHETSIYQTITKDINCYVQENEYHLNLSEDFIGVPENLISVPGTFWTNDIGTIKLEIFKGLQPYEVYSFNTEIISKQCIRYVLDGVSGLDLQTNLSTGASIIEFKIIGLDNSFSNKGGITFELYDSSGNKIETINLSIQKLPQGPEGLPGEYVYMVTNTESIKRKAKFQNATSPDMEIVYEPSTLDVKVYKKKSNQDPELYTVDQISIQEEESGLIWRETNANSISCPLATFAYVIGAPINSLKVQCKIKKADGSYLVIDEETIPILADNNTSYFAMANVSEIFRNDSNEINEDEAYTIALYENDGYGNNKLIERVGLYWRYKSELASSWTPLNDGDIIQSIGSTSTNPMPIGDYLLDIYNNNQNQSNQYSPLSKYVDFEISRSADFSPTNIFDKIRITVSPSKKLTNSTETQNLYYYVDYSNAADKVGTGSPGSPPTKPEEQITTNLVITNSNGEVTVSPKETWCVYDGDVSGIMAYDKWLWTCEQTVTIVPPNETKVTHSAPKLLNPDHQVTAWCVANDKAIENGSTYTLGSLIADSLKGNTLQSLNYKKGAQITDNNDLGGTYQLVKEGSAEVFGWIKIIPAEQGATTGTIKFSSLSPDYSAPTLTYNITSDNIYGLYAGSSLLGVIIQNNENQIWNLKFSFNIRDFIREINYRLVESGAGNYSSKGSYFDLSLGTITTPNFYLDEQGNAYFKGHIEASSGKIGGWNISANSLWFGGAVDSPALYLGIGLNNNAVNSEIRPWMIKAGSTFGVSTDGYLSASSGKIGKILIDSEGLKYSGTLSSGTTSYIVDVNEKGLYGEHRGAIGGWQINFSDSTGFLHQGLYTMLGGQEYTVYRNFSMGTKGLSVYQGNGIGVDIPWELIFNFFGMKVKGEDASGSNWITIKKNEEYRNTMMPLYQITKEIEQLWEYILTL